MTALSRHLMQLFVKAAPDGSVQRHCLAATLTLVHRRISLVVQLDLCVLTGTAVGLPQQRRAHTLAPP